MPPSPEREKLVSQLSKLDEFFLRMMMVIYPKEQSAEEAARKAKEAAIVSLKALYGEKA